VRSLAIPDREVREQIARFENELLIFNNFDFDIQLPFEILKRFQSILVHESSDKGFRLADSEEQHLP